MEISHFKAGGGAVLLWEDFCHFFLLLFLERYEQKEPEYISAAILTLDDIAKEASKLVLPRTRPHLFAPSYNI